MSFGKEIKRIRQLALLTQEDFAREVKVSSASVGRWEKGKGKPHPSTMKAISNFCVQRHIDYAALQAAWCDDVPTE